MDISPQNKGYSSPITPINTDSRTGKRFALLSIFFGVLAALTVTIVFAPLGLLFGLIAILKRQFLLGFLGLFITAFGILISPSVWIIAIKYLTPYL